MIVLTSNRKYIMDCYDHFQIKTHYNTMGEVLSYDVTGVAKYCEAPCILGAFATEEKAKEALKSICLAIKNREAICAIPKEGD